MFKLYEVEWQFVGRLCGSVPQTRELIRPWLEARAPDKRPDTGPSLDELEAQIAATVATEDAEQEEDAEEKVQRITLGFQKDETGLFIWGGNPRAHIKDCAQQLATLFKGKGDTNFKAKVANRCYLMEDRVYILRQDGSYVDKPDGWFERAVHVMTPRGPRNSLKRIHYVWQPILRFTLVVLNDGVIKEPHLHAILRYGSVHGFGGERSMGEGRYRYTLEPKGEVEEIPVAMSKPLEIG